MDEESHTTKNKILDWFMRFAESRHARWWLAFFSFTESSVFPIAPDPLLIAILIANARRWVLDALITTLSSVAGGFAGYIIGAFFWDIAGEAVVEAYNLESEMQKIQGLFGKNAFWTIFLAAFTPIPYKIFTIAGGFFHVDLLIFILASLLGRGSRFFFVGYMIKQFNSTIAPVVFKYFNVFSLLFALYVIVIVLSVTLF